MDESRKLTKTGNDGDEVARTPSVVAQKSPKLTDAAASAAKTAQLQEELEALKQSHKVVVGELNAKVEELNAKVEELEAKVDALKAQNESQICEMKVMKSALQWAYALEEVPRQHWLEQGHDEEYADAMENLLNSMEESIKDLRMGTVSDNGFGGKKIVKIDFDLEDEDGGFIRADHDESLMPYWKELAAALRHWSEYHADGKYLKFDIIYIELPKSVLDILRPAFEQSRIEYVYFENSHHAGDMANFAKKVLQSNHFITEVGFRDIKFAREDVKAICAAIKARNEGDHFMKSLELANCSDDRIVTHTLKMILGSITAVRERDALLNLSENVMSSREAAVIAEFLNSNPSLARLNLENNQFNDADAAVLASTLTNNTQLKNIWLENCRIQEDGRVAFLRAVFDVSSLSSCAASNHTCSVDGLERDISVLNSYKSASVNKWSKIVAMLALSKEDSFINISLLGGVPAQLIPVILDKLNNVGCVHDIHELTDICLELTNATRCQKHDVWDGLGEMRSLNCMYNLMRSWVVPSIFA